MKIFTCLSLTIRYNASKRGMLSQRRTGGTTAVHGIYKGYITLREQDVSHA